MRSTSRAIPRLLAAGALIAVAGYYLRIRPDPETERRPMEQDPAVETRRTVAEASFGESRTVTSVKFDSGTVRVRCTDATSGEPVQGARVTAFADLRRMDEPLDSQTSDQSGSCAISASASTASVIRDGFVPTFVESLTDLERASGGERIVRLSKARTVRGKLVERGGGHISGIEVCAAIEGRVPQVSPECVRSALGPDVERFASARTDADGGFVIEGLREGSRYALTAITSTHVHDPDSNREVQAEGDCNVGELVLVPVYVAAVGVRNRPPNRPATITYDDALPSWLAPGLGCGRSPSLRTGLRFPSLQETYVQRVRAAFARLSPAVEELSIALATPRSDDVRDRSPGSARILFDTEPGAPEVTTPTTLVRLDRFSAEDIAVVDTAPWLDGRLRWRIGFTVNGAPFMGPAPPIRLGAALRHEDGPDRKGGSWFVGYGRDSEHEVVVPAGRYWLRPDYGAWASGTHGFETTFIDIGGDGGVKIDLTVPLCALEVRVVDRFGAPAFPIAFDEPHFRILFGAENVVFVRPETSIDLMVRSLNSQVGVVRRTETLAPGERRRVEIVLPDFR